MIKACRKASKALIRDFGEIENLQIHSKSLGDFVTNADIKSEKILIETLQYYYPNSTYSVNQNERGLWGIEYSLNSLMEGKKGNLELLIT